MKNALPPKTKGYGNRAGSDTGEMSGNGGHEKFTRVLTGPSGAPVPISGIGKVYDDIGEKSGFQTDGYIDKKSSPYGESAKFNFLPPGMDISNQENAEIHRMKLVKLTGISYPGDGWSPEPRDLPE